MRTYTRKRSQYQFIEGVHELCRLCMEKAKKSIPIFTDNNNVCVSLAMRIMMCVGLEITREECLPNIICTECNEELNNYYEFKKKCILTYQKLKSHMLAVKQVENKKKESSKMMENNQQMLSVDNQEFVSLENQQFISVENGQLLTVEDQQFISLDGQQFLPVENLGTFEEDVAMAAIAAQPLQIDLDAITSEALRDNVVEENKVEESLPAQEEVPELSTTPPTLSEFLSTLLLELKILKKDGEDTVLHEPTLRTVEIEADDETVITFKMLEIEEEQPIVLDPVPKKSVIVRHVTGDNVSALIHTELLDDGRPQCAQCGKSFASGGALRRHATVHSGARPFECGACGRSFAQREVLRRHELVHRDVRPHKCRACPKSFTQRGALEAHERSHAAPHARALALHACTKCPKVFLHASGLSRHAHTHNGRVFACGACQRRFNDQSSLLRHLRLQHRASATTAATATTVTTTATTTVTTATTIAKAPPVAEATDAATAVS